MGKSPPQMPRPGRENVGFAAPAQLDLPALEHEILQVWQHNGVERASLQMGADAANAGGETRTASEQRAAYVFFDGPPFATGLPHYGHLLPGTIKDIVPRYWQMRGRAVERRFGWDCHGLPIESLVENELGVHGRREIEDYGLHRFNAACRAGVLRFTKEWEQTVRRMGRWVDFVDDYKTMDVAFMESVWWVFRQLWEKGLIYEGHRVQPVSPSLGTPLSNFEVAQGPQERDPVTRKEGHRRRQDPSITVRFALEDEDASLWAWTTTPWTLPSNLALAVHPEFTYVKVRIVDTGEIAYLEPSRLADYQARERVGATEELARVRGAELVGRPYLPLFPFFERYKQRGDGSRWAFRVVAAEYVTTESGTGIVHQAPAFGEDDYEVGKREGLPVINPLSLNGVFDDSVPDFAGQFAKDADKHIIEALKHKGRLVDQDVIVHPYPHCYRTEDPLLYMALSTWFMRVEQIKDQLVENNRKITWVPEHVGTGRFGNWLEAARDWNLARNRFWGTPLPIWRCDQNPDEIMCFGSIAELEHAADLEPGTITDLHRENIDAITFPARSTPGGVMRRVSEVFDCWFESGSMPYAQNHYPFDASKRAYVERNLPADFIAEGLDQTRGWFYTLHVLATALFQRPAFSHVIVNGLVLAEDGKKMSKRLKNYPDLMEVVERYGADALRAYLVNSAAVKAEPMRFSERGVRDTVRLVFLPLWNAYNFLATYARADGYEPRAADLSLRPRGALDRWIVSRVQGFVHELREEFDGYRLFNLVPAFLRISDDINNWYIRRGRRRYWRARDEGPEAERDKLEAYATLYRVLVTVTHAIAPIVPFFSEALYRRLVVDTGVVPDAGDSVHLRSFPEADASLRDEILERKLEAVRRVVGLGMTVRERERIAVRRPLPKLTIASADAFVRSALQEFADDVLGELNVKQLEVRADDHGLVRVSAKANFKTLGKRLGPKMKAVAAAVAAMDARQIEAVLQQGSVELEGEVLHVDDLLVVREAVPGHASEASDGMTVVLDTHVDERLRLEGLAREIVNRIQNLRKTNELDVSQRINVHAVCGSELAKVFADPALLELLRGETLATTIERVETGVASERFGNQVSDEIDGMAIAIALEPLEGHTSS